MAATLVYSIDSSLRQMASWSTDNRIAINTDKEMHILKFDVSPNNTSSRFHADVMVSLTPDDLTDRICDIWTDLDISLFNADRATRSSFLKKWTFSSLVSDDQIYTAWYRHAWSPVRVTPDDRTVLACVTNDHRLVIFGHCSKRSKWLQLADLGEELIKHHREDYRSKCNNLKSNNQKLDVIYEQMTSLAFVHLVWSNVIQGKQADGQAKFVFLFVFMKNGDIVTWKLDLPFTGIESCEIIHRLSAFPESEVTCAAWASWPNSNNTGVLAVGLQDGRVELVHYCYDSKTKSDRPFTSWTQSINGPADLLPVSSLIWVKSQQLGGLALVYSKGLIASVYVLAASDCRDGEKPGDTKGRKGRGGNTMKVVGSSHTQLGCLANLSAPHYLDSTIVAAGDEGCVIYLSVTGSAKEPDVKCVRTLPFKVDEDKNSDWECFSVAMSPSGLLCSAVFKPNFPYNYLNDRFRYPVETRDCPMYHLLCVLYAQIHVCPVSELDFGVVEELLSTDKGRSTPCRTDVLEFGRQAICSETVTEAAVVSMLQRFTTSPYTDSQFGRRLARHLLSTLYAICRNQKMMAQVEDIKAVLDKGTEKLLCQQISTILQSRSSMTRESLLDRNLPILNTMYKWASLSANREKAVGSKVMTWLASVVDQSKLSTCVFCDSAPEVNFVGVESAECSNKHSFGLCCHTVCVVNTATYQRCSTCGALALPLHQLTDFGLLPADGSTCTLCGSYLHSSKSYVCV